MKRVVKAAEEYSVDLDTVKDDVGDIVYNDLVYKLDDVVESFLPEDIAKRVEGYNADFASADGFKAPAYPKFDQICSMLTDIIVDVLCKNAEY